MFSSIAALLRSKYFLSWPSFLPPISFLKSMSSCLPKVFFISAIKGVTVTFLPTLASILDFNTRTLDSTLASAVDLASSLSTRLLVSVLYLGFSIAAGALSSLDTTCLAVSLSVLSVCARSWPSSNNALRASSFPKLTLENINSPNVILASPDLRLAAGLKLIKRSLTLSIIFCASSLLTERERM